MLFSSFLSSRLVNPLFRLITEFNIKPNINLWSKLPLKLFWLKGWGGLRFNLIRILSTGILLINVYLREEGLLKFTLTRVKTKSILGISRLWILLQQSFSLGCQGPLVLLCIWGQAKHLRIVDIEINAIAWCPLFLHLQINIILFCYPEK